MIIKKYIISFMLVMAFTITACSNKPVYRTSYDLIQPSSINGRQCTTQCDTNRLLCQQNERAERSQCEDRERSNAKQCKQNAYVDYRNCMQQASHLGKYRASTESNCNSIRNSKVSSCDNNYSRCDRRSRCDGAYRSCFSNCGGTVKKNTYCVRNCEKKK